MQTVQHRRRPAAVSRTPRLPTTRVQDVMTREPITVSSWTLVEHAERLATSCGVHHLLVTDGERLLGVFCLCDVWRSEAHDVAADLMQAPPATIDALASLDEAADAMNEQAVGCLPVLDGDRLAGVITRGDLQRAGALGDDYVRVCAACGTRHHVSAAAESASNAIGFCTECLERGRAFDCDDPYDELGGSGD